MLKIQYPDYDLLNQIRFLHSYDKGVYNCVMCGNEVTLDESYSDGGHKLICINCRYEYFKTTSKLIDWLDEE